MLNLEFAHGRSGFQPTVENLPKEKSAEKIHRKIRQSKQKTAGTRPPRNPPAKPKNLPQNLPTNPPVKPPSTRRVFSIEKVCSWRRLQSMDSGTLFGCLLGMVEVSMLKRTCNPSAAAGGMDKVCCAPFQTTRLVKSVPFEKTAQKQQIKSATRLCHLWQPKCILICHSQPIVKLAVARLLRSHRRTRNPSKQQRQKS